MTKIAVYETYPPIEQIFGCIHQEPDAAFLDSSLENDLGRYSIIGRKPYLKLVKGDRFTVNGVVCDEPFADYVKRYLRAHQRENPYPFLPLTDGAIGYFSYDYGREQEGVETRHPKTVDVPEAVLAFYDELIIEDHKAHRLYLIANGHRQDADDGLLELKALVGQAADGEAKETQQPAPGKAAANFTQPDYLDAVRQMIAYIAAGDIYIANMTQQLTVSSDLPPYALFRRLRRANPSPFGGYLQYGDFQIVSSSPERFLQMRGGIAETRPIKGTRKRGATPAEDTLLRRELKHSEKDKSELLMIVDLERNDLNRVCIPGSVTVDALFAVEAYATVFHLVATVTGTLEPGRTVMDLLESMFPGGSITGAPKLRAMEIIDALEHSRRGIYTGSMGYLSLSGDCDFNIMIRTALHRQGTYQIGVGGGITWESEPSFEYAETLQKAKALLYGLNVDCKEEGGTISADSIG